MIEAMLSAYAWALIWGRVGDLWVDFDEDDPVIAATYAVARTGPNPFV